MKIDRTSMNRAKSVAAVLLCAATIGCPTDGDPPMTDTVLNLIKNSQDGLGVSKIREATGYDDKKLRNIIYRLNQMGKISRVSRGRYRIRD